MSNTPTSPQVPHLRIVRGAPDDVEVAAVIAALAAAAQGPAASAQPPRSLWASRSRNVRPSVRPGPGAWRASSLPR